ncbi:MAG TPA: hypothetical protein VM711_01435, partial [Sphingomicrobium sp.]|nr:hypothetical protein [Sphingomicrobium sp.]
KSFRGYLLDLRRLVSEGRKSGFRDDTLVRYVEPKLKSLYPDWPIGDRAATFEVRYMDEELAGTKLRPIPAKD